MPRKPRLHVPGGVYHVILRGNDGQRIFADHDDYRRLYQLLADGVERYGHRIHGFCCMPNHLHLIVQVADVSLSRVVQNLAFRYARWFNWRWRRVGHLFQGRFKAILVDHDAYLLALVRYVHLNPVRAGLVTTPDGYPWSGHGAYVGRQHLPWLTTDWVLRQFAPQQRVARRHYQAFVADGLEDNHRQEFHRGGKADERVLADDQFIERLPAARAVLAPAPTLDHIIERVCDRYGVAVSAVAAPSRRRGLVEPRAVVALLAREAGAATLSEVAAVFRRSVSNMSRQVAELEAGLRSEPELARRIESLRKSITQA